MLAFRNQNGFGLLPIILLIVIIGASATLYFNNQSSPLIFNNPTPTEDVASPTPLPDEYEDWKTYVNEEYKYQIKYPPNFSLLSGDSQAHLKIGLIGLSQPEGAGTVDQLVILINDYAKRADQSFADFISESNQNTLGEIYSSDNLMIHHYSANRRTGLVVEPFDSYTIELSPTTLLVITGSYAGTSYPYSEIFEEIVKSIEFTN